MGKKSLIACITILDVHKTYIDRQAVEMQNMSLQLGEVLRLLREWLESEETQVEEPEG